MSDSLTDLLVTDAQLAMVAARELDDPDALDPRAWAAA